MDKTLNLAKISVPSAEHIYHRQHLFDVFNKALSKSVVWISSPAGSGKTLFVADYLRQKKLSTLWFQVDEGDGDIASFFYYLGLAGKKANPLKRKSLPLLTPEYLAGLPTFTRNYFRDLFSRLKQPCILVFDNYQDAPADSPLHELMQIAVAEIPENVHIIFISRVDPPAPYARLLMSDLVSRIGWQDFSLSNNEVRELIKLRSNVSLEQDALSKIQQQFEGWITGLILWIEQTKGQDDTAHHLYSKEQDVIFHYFANEIFSKAQPEVQDFLLKTSYLPFINPNTANEITCSEDSDRILLDLVKNNYFITKPGKNTYRYHPLFQNYLLHKAATKLDKVQQLENRRHAAQALLKSGQMEEAIKIVIESEDWQLASRLIIEQAPALLKQGRNNTLASWINVIPQCVIAKVPWLTFWLGMARLMVDPVSARKDIENAYLVFNEQQDIAGIYSAWSGVIDSYIVAMDNYIEFDKWFDEYDKIAARFQVPSIPDIETRVSVSMVAALVMRRPWQADIEQWIKRAITLTRQSGDVSLQVQCFFYFGYFDLCFRSQMQNEHINHELDRLYEKPETTALDKIRILMFKTFFLQWQLHTHDNLVERFIKKALDIAEESGVVVLNYMLIGNLALAKMGSIELEPVQRLITTMASSAIQMGPWDEAFYHFLVGAHAWLSGDTTKAVNELLLGDSFHQSVGEYSSSLFHQHLLARVLIDHGDFDQARQCLDSVWSLINRINDRSLIQEAVLTEAYFAMRTGNDNSTEQFLRRFFEPEDHRQLHFVRTFLWRPNIIKEIVIRALELEITVPQVSSLIRQYRHLLGKPPLHLESWPWPIKIYTLGRFSLVKDGQPLSFTGKGQNKPLELLKVLIAYGGRDVEKEKLIETLWPDADADMANQSFDTTLFRLRKFLGQDALQLQDRHLTLNPHYTWVDVWSFERQLSALDRELSTQSPDIASLQQGLHRLLRLYQNNFCNYSGLFLNQEAGTGKKGLPLMASVIESRIFRPCFLAVEK